MSPSDRRRLSNGMEQTYLRSFHIALENDFPFQLFDFHMNLDLYLHHIFIMFLPSFFLSFFIILTSPPIRSYNAATIGDPIILSLNPLPPFLIGPVSSPNPNILDFQTWIPCKKGYIFSLHQVLKIVRNPDFSHDGFHSCRNYCSYLEFTIFVSRYRLLVS